MGGFTVLETPEGDDIWNNYVKPGKVKGVSVEGSFILNFSKQTDPDYLLLNQIINILKNIEDER
jgi:phage head maturation protease